MCRRKDWRETYPNFRLSPCNGIMEALFSFLCLPIKKKKKSIKNPGTRLSFGWHRFPRSEFCFYGRGSLSLDPHATRVSSSLWMLGIDVSAPCTPLALSSPFLSGVGGRWDKNLFLLFLLPSRLAEQLCPSF